MIFCLSVALYLGEALYIAAGLLALAFLRKDDSRLLAVAVRLAAGGAVCLAAAFGLRWAIWGLVPMTTLPDSVNMLVFFSTLAMVYLFRKPNLYPLASFYLPPMALLCVVSAAVAHTYFFTAPRALPGVPLTIHVSLAFLAYAHFFLAAMTSAAYLCQAQRLKRHNTKGLFHRLPALEQLDQTLVRLVNGGYPLFLITLVLGGGWAYAERELLGPHWFLAPKVFLSFVMALFYTVVQVRRRGGRLRGQKLAQVMFAGFVLLLALYVALMLAQLRNYNFWGTGA